MAPLPEEIAGEVNNVADASMAMDKPTEERARG
jgi:hypothetical protein